MLYFSKLRVSLLVLLFSFSGQLLAQPSKEDVEALAKIYPAVDPFLGEKLQKTEIEDAQALIDTLQAKIASDYPKGSVRRDAHPKAHGCVAATFKVNEDLSSGLGQGIFTPGASYKAKIRFSNGSPNATGDDITGDTRGMAIKLYDVPGEKLFSRPGQEDVHDFILISSPLFFVNNSDDYARFFEAVNSGSGWQMAKIPFYLGFQGSINAFEMLQQTIANPLETRYWSVVPYQLGLGDDRRAVKYSAQPCSPGESVIPENPDKNFLREAMVKSLNEGPACMIFMVQPRPDDSFAVEDVITEWSEDKAPFYPVAKITIDQQEFNTEEKNTDCENESYNPWHALETHKPLGTISRIRRVVYQALSDFRHELNDVVIEPAKVEEEGSDGSDNSEANESSEGNEEEEASAE